MSQATPLDGVAVKPTLSKNEMLTAPQVAGRLGVKSTSSVYRYVALGILPPPDAKNPDRWLTTAIDGTLKTILTIDQWTAELQRDAEKKGKSGLWRAVGSVSVSLATFQAIKSLLVEGQDYAE